MAWSAREFPALGGLRGLSDGLVEAHLKLYRGYVSAANALQRAIGAHAPATPEGAELRRRLGFEVNGMRLHELYFEALRPAGQEPSAGVRDLLASAWGSFDAWRDDFLGMGRMRGIGWVVLYRDPATGALANYWIDRHDHGHPAGFTPLVTLDVWEHAYTGLERPAYLDAFLANLDWEVVERRARKPAS